MACHTTILQTRDIAGSNRSRDRWPGSACAPLPARSGVLTAVWRTVAHEQRHQHRDRGGHAENQLVASSRKEIPVQFPLFLIHRPHLRLGHEFTHHVEVGVFVAAGSAVSMRAGARSAASGLFVVEFQLHVTAPRGRSSRTMKELLPSGGVSHTTSVERLPAGVLLEQTLKAAAK
jgi:hypothetical protein